MNKDFIFVITILQNVNKSELFLIVQNYFYDDDVLGGYKLSLAFRTVVEVAHHL